MLLDSDGNLIQDYASYLDCETHLAVMPVARLFVEWSPRAFPQGLTFYPAGMVDTTKLGVVPNKADGTSHAEHCSYASGVDENALSEHSLVVFPCRFNWDHFRKNSHTHNLEFIRWLSDHVDQKSLNFIRYRQCPMFTNGDPIHNLPARAGQLNTNHMMSGALLYNHGQREARIIGGDAFTHIVTRGLGLALSDIDSEEFPRDGEVGSVVSHALALYTAILEANTQTAIFVQSLSLLEFLAFPDAQDFHKFQEVKKVICPYITNDPKEYSALLNRFQELTGKKEEATGRNIGYRTRLVHLGRRIEDIVPELNQRKELLSELDGYIRAVIDHMIWHSNLSWNDYLSIRKTLGPNKNRTKEDQEQSS